MKYNILEPEKTSEEDFELAKSLGYMFDKAEQTHEEAMRCAFEELNKCKKIKTTNLFLASLSSARLEWRIGLAAFAIMRVFPKHDLKSNGINCLICPSTPKSMVDFSFINSIRFGEGGLITGSIYHLAFILKQHNNLPNVEPLKQDFEIFKSIIETIKSAKANDGPSETQKRIGKTKGFKSNKEQRKVLLETLGYCSILETYEHIGFLNQYTNLGSAPRSRHSSDWLYPVDWWKGKDGVNKEALKNWFGEYKELQDLIK